MIVSSRSVDSVEVVSLPERFDSTVASQVRDDVRQLISDGKVKLAFDLSNISFIDSSGLGVLVTALKSTKKQKGEVGLIQPSPSARAVIELTRLHRVFDIYDDESAAVSKLAAL